MSLFAIISALLLEKFYPLSKYLALNLWLSRYVEIFHRYFNTGLRKHGKAAWLLAVLPLLTASVFITWLLHYAHPIFAWVFNVLVLYLTLGFHPFTVSYTRIQQALKQDQLEQARTLLSEWNGHNNNELTHEEVVRVTIEQALLTSHRHIFAVIAWFVLFSVVSLGGATGALLYRLAHFLSQHWGSKNAIERTSDEYERISEQVFGEFARRAFYALDWLPIRITALTFAIVGNFEDTVYCWRTQAKQWANRETGILLASGAGALGVRLGMPIKFQDGLLERPELGIGDEVDADFMHSVTGLIWRSIGFLLILLLLMSLANLLG